MDTLDNGLLKKNQNYKSCSSSQTIKIKKVNLKKTKLSFTDYIKEWF